MLSRDNSNCFINHLVLRGFENYLEKIGIFKLVFCNSVVSVLYRDSLDTVSSEVTTYSLSGHSTVVLY